MRVWERGSGETLACGTGAAGWLVGGLAARSLGKGTRHRARAGAGAGALPQHRPPPPPRRPLPRVGVPRAPPPAPLPLVWEDIRKNREGAGWFIQPPPVERTAPPRPERDKHTIRSNRTAPLFAPQRPPGLDDPQHEDGDQHQRRSGEGVWADALRRLHFPEPLHRPGRARD